MIGCEHRRRTCAHFALPTSCDISCSTVPAQAFVELPLATGGARLARRAACSPRWSLPSSPFTSSLPLVLPARRRAVAAGSSAVRSASSSWRSSGRVTRAGGRAAGPARSRPTSLRSSRTTRPWRRERASRRHLVVVLAGGRDVVGQVVELSTGVTSSSAKAASRASSAPSSGEAPGGVEAPSSPAAPAAPAHMHPEPARDRTHGRKIRLELLCDPDLLDLPAAARARRRQRHFDRLVGVLRRLPERPPALLAARPLRVGFGSPFENGAACRFPARSSPSTRLS